MRSFLDLSGKCLFVVMTSLALLLPGFGYAQTPAQVPAFVPPGEIQPVLVDPAAVPPPPVIPGEQPIDDLLKKIDEAATQIEPPPPPVPEIIPEQTTEAPTANDALVSPSDTIAPPVGIDTVPGSAGVAIGTPPTDVGVVPALPPDAAADPNLFFDADSLVPAGEMGIKSGPRKVDPVTQPASKYVIVTKDYSPGSRQAQLVSAERAVMLGRYDSALELYNTLYEKNKRDPNVLMGRAVALQHLGDIDAAVQAYEELLDLQPGNVEAEVNMLGLMGERYPAVGLQRLVALREKNPESVAIVGQIAVLEASLGNYEEAVKYLGIAASLEPHNAEHLFNIAVISDRAGKKTDAIKFYEQALETDSIYGGGRSIPREAVFDRLARLR